MEQERQTVGRPAGLEVSVWMATLVRGPRDEGQMGDRLRAMDGMNALDTLEQQRDWEQKRRRDLRHHHTFYSPRKRARAPAPSGQLTPRARRTSSQ